MLTTLAMVRNNKTYGNRMVDVRATNAELVARAFSLVRDITRGADPVVAAALEDADGEVKTTIAVILTGLPSSTARSRTSARGGSGNPPPPRGDLRSSGDGAALKPIRLDVV